MRLFFYRLLTQFIIVLGELRDSFGLDVEVRRDRTFRDPPHLFSTVCCDCGLTHRLFRREDTRYQQPVRPIGYDYSMRMLGGSSGFEDEGVKREEEWLT